MSRILDTRKKFNFLVEINGIPQFEVQKFKVPSVSIEQSNHAEANSDIKTAGRVMIENATFEKLRPVVGFDNEMWNWLTSAQNHVLGTGSLPTNYKRNIVVRELAPNGITLSTYVLTGAWCCKIEQDEYDRATSDKMLTKGEISVDSVIVI